MGDGQILTYVGVFWFVTHSYVGMGRIVAFVNT